MCTSARTAVIWVRDDGTTVPVHRVYFSPQRDKHEEEEREEEIHAMQVSELS